MKKYFFITRVDQEHGPFPLSAEVSPDLIGQLFSEQHCDERLPWASVQTDYGVPIQSRFKQFHLQAQGEEMTHFSLSTFRKRDFLLIQEIPLSSSIFL